LRTTVRRVLNPPTTHASAPASAPSAASSDRPFEHIHAGHCESGVTAALLQHEGLKLSEPIVFGLGSGLFFFYPPLVRVMGMPLISYRNYPGAIFKLACKRLGVQTQHQCYRNEARGAAALDQLLEQGTPVGLRTNMFWLSYFPREFRSQFNGHNLIALERDGGEYVLSDPVLTEPVRLDAESLRRARFAKGVLAPRGAIYYPTHVPQKVELKRALLTALKHTTKRMNDPFPLVGVAGIRRLARHVRAWAHKVPDERRQRLLLGHIVRMQEEVGTGGGGFRFMYAAFLQEAAEILEHEPLSVASEWMTEAGDLWRTRFAGTSVRIIKDRRPAGENLSDAADVLEECADKESQIFRYLRDHMPRRP